MSNSDISTITKRLASDLKILVYVQVITLCVLGLIIFGNAIQGVERVGTFSIVLLVLASLVFVVAVIWGCIKLMKVPLLSIPIWFYIGSVFIFLLSLVGVGLAAPWDMEYVFFLICVFPFYCTIPQFFIARWLARRTNVEYTLQAVLKYQKFWARLVLSVLAILVVGGMLGWQYRVHLLWKYAEWRGTFNAKAIPHTEMPVVEIPEDWLECSLGCLRFRLPPHLAATENVQTRETQRVAVYGDDTLDYPFSVTVVIPSIPSCSAHTNTGK